MTNESLVSLPPNIEDPVVLRRFLARLVEQLDVILGKRSNPKQEYADQEQLLALSNELTEELKNAKDTLENAISDTDALTKEELIKLVSKNKEVVNKLDAITLVNNNQTDRLTSLEQAGYVTDAPSDGNSYARKDGAWVIIP